jgi:8-oxo-dGTP diphosphatase
MSRDDAAASGMVPEEDEPSPYGQPLRVGRIVRFRSPQVNFDDALQAGEEQMMDYFSDGLGGLRVGHVAELRSLGLFSAIKERIGLDVDVGSWEAVLAQQLPKLIEIVEGIIPRAKGVRGILEDLCDMSRAASADGCAIGFMLGVPGEDRATRASWKQRLDPPARMASLPYARTFSREEFARIQHGVVPQEMEDKWFIYTEGLTTYFHRSWTGVCVFQVQFEPCEAGYRATSTLVNRDPTQYKEGDGYDEVEDMRLLDFVVNFVVLQKDPDVEQDEEGKVEP